MKYLLLCQSYIYIFHDMMDSFFSFFLHVGGSGFTDRVPILLALDATIVQQVRPFGFSDFLNPAYLHPGIHVIPVKEHLSNLVQVVQEMRADPMRMQRVNAAATALVHHRLTDHACLCAVR